ncbi:E2 family protein B [Nannocystis exedens]|uniref:E2 family protein B n=1 Tax=Nannocystis exedens TaxID=54 RepID=A0A1I2ATN4_9BACT|nr:ThiF family adenylyltransferase [Nannocystis exedens]PCC74262.1 thiamine/molybdopterin biosynthesis ThiF/MoeB-like protein [Nannocystis exedens]SFE47176.1 E2 family protein B [Nannocystis exedens]
MHADDLTATAELLCAAGLLEQGCVTPADALLEPWARLHGVVAAIEGVAHVDGHALALRLGLTPRFPGRLPTVFVLDARLHGRIPHVFQHGHVCYQEYEGVLLDRYQPVAVAREALARAVETIRRGLTGENRADFIEELALYWPGAAEGLGFFAADAQIQPILRFVLPWAGTFAFVRDRAQARELLVAPMPLRVPEVMAPLEAWFDDTVTPGLYIPLEDVPRPPDPFPLGPWTRAQVAQLIRHNLSDGQRRRLEQLTRGLKTRSTFVILRVPRPRGGDHLVGIRYDDIRGAHPLARATGSATMTQFRVERRDPGYLVPRGGGEPPLRAKRVLLVGCGAIGGHLAGELVRCGVGHLTLVDPDVLRPENAYRHVLGAPSLFVLPAKSLQLAAEIQQRYRGVEVSGLAASIEDALDQGAIDVTRYDLVLSATGDPNVDRGLNERLHRLEHRPPLLFTWLEPLGIGGHALVVQRSSPGCLDCLFTPHPLDASPVLTNRAAFAAAGQVFTRELAGCGNAFTPYSSLDALRTAELAGRLAVEVLGGRLRETLLRSWKGDGAAFHAAGLRTSPRYEMEASALERGGADVVAAGCKVCGGR